MDPETIEEIINRKNRYVEILKNNPDMPRSFIEMYKANIETLEVTLEIMKNE